jgi:hypothetical protein
MMRFTAVFILLTAVFGRFAFANKAPDFCDYPLANAVQAAEMIMIANAEYADNKAILTVQKVVKGKLCAQKITAHLPQGSSQSQKSGLFFLSKKDGKWTLEPLLCARFKTAINGKKVEIISDSRMQQSAQAFSFDEIQKGIKAFMKDKSIRKSEVKDNPFLSFLL